MRLFVRAGLVEVAVDAAPVVLRDPTAFDNAMGLRTWAAVAHERGFVNASDVAAWTTAIDDAIENGSFLYAFTVFLTSGTKP